MDEKLEKAGFFGKCLLYIRMLGPGLITGASDDDPGGIGTYSQTGAQFGYAQLWTALFTAPLMIAVQEACARIAMQTGNGLAGTIKQHYPRWLLYACILLLCIANTVNIGADLGAMAASVQMLLGFPFVLWLAVIALISILLQVFISYRLYARILRYLTFTLLSYIFVALVVPQDWGAVLRHTFIPTIQFTGAYWLNLVAILGTTISPYLFFWQADQEIEEEIAHGKITMQSRRGVSRGDLKRMRYDVAVGMILSNLVTWFIIITAASTLYRSGNMHIDTAVEAAQALRPIAGNFAYLLFAAGIIGTGFLVVPILAGSTAYAVAESFDWCEGLFLKFLQAPGFYAIIILSTVVGALLNIIGISPIRALYYSAAVNGIIAPPLLVIIMLIAGNRNIMGQRASGPLSKTLGWIATMLMSLAAIGLFLNIRSAFR